MMSHHVQMIFFLWRFWDLTQVVILELYIYITGDHKLVANFSLTINLFICCIFLYTKYIIYIIYVSNIYCIPIYYIKYDIYLYKYKSHMWINIYHLYDICEIHVHTYPHTHTLSLDTPQSALISALWPVVISWSSYATKRSFFDELERYI